MGKGADEVTDARSETKQLPGEPESDDGRITAIEADIEDTRSEMGQTLDEIGERLDPARLADEAKDKVREATVGRVEDAVDSAGHAARGMSDMVIDTIRRNPIPAAMAGIGLAMLWQNRSGNGQQGRAGSGGPNLMQEARRTTTQLGDKLGNTAGEAAQSVQQVAGDVADGAQQRAGALSTQGLRLVNEAPLVAGLAAIGAGATVGALLPGTPVEREFLAEPSSSVTQAAAEVANDVADRAQQVAERASGTIRREAGS
jgi:Protein of unknown function (DUF3618)